MEKSKGSYRGNASSRGGRGHGNWKSVRGQGRGGGSGQQRNESPNQLMFKEQQEKNKLQLKEVSGGGPKEESGDPTAPLTFSAWEQPHLVKPEDAAGGDDSRVNLEPKNQEEEERMYEMALRKSMEESSVSSQSQILESEPLKEVKDEKTKVEFSSDNAVTLAQLSTAPLSQSDDKNGRLTPPFPPATKSQRTAEPPKLGDECGAITICATTETLAPTEGEKQGFTKAGARFRNERGMSAKKVGVLKDKQAPIDFDGEESNPPISSIQGDSLGQRSRDASASPVPDKKVQSSEDGRDQRFTQGRTNVDRRLTSDQHFHRNGHPRYGPSKNFAGRRGSPRSGVGDQRNSEIAPTAKTYQRSPPPNEILKSDVPTDNAGMDKQPTSLQEAAAESPEETKNVAAEPANKGPLALVATSSSGTSHDSQVSHISPPPAAEAPTLDESIPRFTRSDALLPTPLPQPTIEEQLRVSQDKLARWEELFGNSPEAANARFQQLQRQQVVPIGLSYGYQYGSMPPQYQMPGSMQMPLMQSYTMAMRPPAPPLMASNEDSTDSSGENNEAVVAAAQHLAHLATSRAAGSTHDAISLQPLMPMIPTSFPTSNSPSLRGFFPNGSPPGYPTASAGGQPWNGALHKQPSSTVMGLNESRLSVNATPFYPPFEESSAVVESTNYPAPYGYSSLPNQLALLQQQQQMVTNAIASYQTDPPPTSSSGGYPGPRNVRGAIDNGCYRRYNEQAVSTGYQQAYGGHQYSGKRVSGDGNPLEYQVSAPPYPESVFSFQQQQQQGVGLYLPQQTMLYNPGGARFVPTTNSRHPIPRQRGRGRGSLPLGGRY